MYIKKSQWKIFIVNILILVFFGIFYIAKKNYEFLIYMGVIVFFLLLIVSTNRKVNYSNGVLWGLTVWAFLHLAGGSFKVNGEIWYKFILIPLGKTYPVLKYDQVVHMIGFAVATIIMYQLLKPLLKDKINKWTALSIVIVMAGLGVGALNEIVEFIIVTILPQTGVGGYINTSLDLVADLIGAVAAIIIIQVREKKR